MGTAELYKKEGKLVIRSVFHFYGGAASTALSQQVAAEIAAAWNEPKAVIRIKRGEYLVEFEIEGQYAPDLVPTAVWHNTDPRRNFFRIEEFSAHDISFVDSINCNTGYFKLSNLLNDSKTAAHEYGHTLGLDHPLILDIRGKGQPGIMYPRGTICDPAYQYDPHAQPLQPGGTLNPALRKVLPGDIAGLQLHRLSFDREGLGIVGEFSSMYHERHEKG
ncbi:MAG: peptidase M10 [Puia sp.]|nr:peptidase M10 [Puia sp.]